MHNSGASRREIAKLWLRTIWLFEERVSTLTVVIARLGRATQDSRDAWDGIEKPRRPGYPAGACHRARRRRDPVAGYDD
jgi:hypothetical protein